MGTAGRKDLQREAVVNAALALIIRGPFAAFTREAVCQESGVKYSTVRSYFPDADVLVRLAAARLFSIVNGELRQGGSESGESVHSAVATYVAAVAELAASDRYAHLLRIVIREADTNTWLIQLYDEQIAGTFEAELSQRVLAAGGRYGAHVTIRSGAARAALRRLETELAVPRLLPPGRGEVGPADVAPAAVQALISATYAWDLQAATAA